MKTVHFSYRASRSLGSCRLLLPLEANLGRGKKRMHKHQNWRYLTCGLDQYFSA